MSVVFTLFARLKVRLCDGLDLLTYRTSPEPELQPARINPARRINVAVCKSCVARLTLLALQNRQCIRAASKKISSSSAAQTGWFPSRSFSRMHSEAYRLWNHP